MYFRRKGKAPAALTRPASEGRPVQGTGRNGLPSSQPARCGHSRLYLPLAFSPTPTSQLGPNALLASSHPASFPGGPVLAAQVQGPLERGNALPVVDPVPASLSISSAHLAPRVLDTRKFPSGGGQGADLSCGSPSLLSLGVSQPGEGVQFLHRPLGAARRLWLVPPVKAPPPHRRYLPSL